MLGSAKAPSGRRVLVGWQVGMFRAQSYDLIESREGATVRLALIGELDMASGPPLERRLEQLAARPLKEVVVDMRLTTFIDCATVATLLNAAAVARVAGWKLTIIPGPPGVRRVFEFTKTLDVLPFAGPDDAALQPRCGTARRAPRSRRRAAAT